MSFLKEKQKPMLPLRQTWRGIVATNPTDLSDRMAVVLPDFDSNFRWENCRWQSRDAVSLPLRGDPCLCIQDNHGELWVVAWWPFST